MFKAFVAGVCSAFLLAVPASTAGQIRIPATPGTASLVSVHDYMQTWLKGHGYPGFRVTKVMAFAAYDYVAVTDRNGRPAFELLFAPTLRWVSQEPQSVMWNTRYGMMSALGNTMMGLSYNDSAGRVASIGKAVAVANSWLGVNRPNERAGSDGRAFPGYFTLDTARGGRTAGMLSVNAATGTVWYHSWLDRYLGGLSF